MCIMIIQALVLLYCIILSTGNNDCQQSPSLVASPREEWLKVVEYQSCLGSWCIKRTRNEFDESNLLKQQHSSPPSEPLCCPPGYRGLPPANCIDINECDSGDNGGCSQHCFNTEGSYYCKCEEEDYKLAEDGKSCDSTNTRTRGKRSSPSKDYYVAGLVNYFNTNPNSYYFYITTQSTTGVPYTVKSYSGTTVSSGTVYKSAAKEVSLGVNQLVASLYWSERHKGYHVHTDGPSSLIVVNHKDHTIGEYPAYPYEKPAGVTSYTYYAVSSVAKLKTDSRSQILLVGTEDSTTVTVYPKATTLIGPVDAQKNSYSTVNIYSWSPKAYTLHKQDTLLLRSKAYTTDVTGTKIVSNKPLTVITGHQCGNVPYDVGYCEHLSEQIPPTFDWGEKFLLTPYQFRLINYYMVMSQEDHTTIKHNCNSGTLSKIVHAGNKYMFASSNAKSCYLTSNEPILLTQISPGRLKDGLIGDPTITVVPPMTKFDTSTSFTLPVYPIVTKYGFNIVAKKKTGTWKRNGITISGLTWKNINDFNSNAVGYYAMHAFPSGYQSETHVITNSENNEFYVLGYGFGIDIAYSFTVGILSEDCDSGYQIVLGKCEDINECLSNPCGVGLICTNTDGSYTCGCNDGYIPVNGKCEDINECTTNTDSCEYKCHNTNGGYYCSCKTGYQLYDKYHCQDIHECAANTDGCSQICTNTVGSFICSCNPGFQLYFGKYCSDINECNTNKGGCSDTCINTYGSYYCTCNSGYYLTGNGKTCKDINECAYACPQGCTNTEGSYSCYCFPGYTGSNCHIDINECSTNKGGCAQSCTNTVGSFFCTCNHGYTLNSNMLSCNDVNECNTNNGGCEHTCTNTVGSYKCSCKSGYVLDGDGHGCSPSCSDTCGHCSSCDSPNSCSCVPGWKGYDCCTDRPECSTNNGGCQQICLESLGSFSCTCNTGYRLNSNGKKCDDINECAKNTDECNHNCINTVGSYTCSCYTGYELGLDDHTCVDTNECAINNGGCAQTCINSVGSYTCSCKSGYALSSNGKSCIDINECNGANDCSGTCYNTAGSYSCDCEEGKELGDDGVTCEPINYCGTDNGDCDQMCTNGASGPVCSCLTGYILDHDKKGCSDHDECTQNTDACDQNCFNSHSSYYCTCNDGYTLGTDGRTCTDINECADDISGCSHQCVNTPPGSYTCSCYNGYTLDSNGKTCTDIIECLTNNGGCAHTCTNTDGGRTCSCDSGYELAFDNLNCDDIDECAEETDYCEQTCTNTIGGYTCGCNTGYQLNGKYHCEDVNECDSNNGGCGQTCTNTIGSFKCSCKDGYTLSSNGKTCNEINECNSNNGGCDHTCTNTPAGSYTCSCKTGYSLDGDDHGCSPVCADDCGHCESCNSPNSCSCVAGWKGSDCCTDINECSTNNGGCQQLCLNSQGSFSCTCKDGYTLNSNGKKCDDINECALNTDECNHNCINTVGSYTCSCNTGYELGLDDHTCVDTNECAINNGGCNQTCTNTDGSFTCSCKSGYTANGKDCEDIDECTLDTDDCSDTCINNIGSYTCDCAVGYKLDTDSATCVDFEECSVDNGGCDQTCVNEDGSYHCECLTGYILDEDKHGCSDHDECAQNTDACDHNCHNSHSSYYCTCNDGYTLGTDGRTCTDIDECADYISGCAHKCSNTPGSYECLCNDGYTLHSNGKECTDIDECSTDNGGCDHTCTNTDGSFTCSCNDGYELDFNEHSCNDINECKEGTNYCEHVCDNTDGGYTCSCNTGFQESDDGYHCSNINECNNTDNGGCDQICNDTVGSYKCSCKSGYKLRSDLSTCDEINECLDDNGGCEHTCTNTNGSYYCTCDDGFDLDLAKKGCIPICQDNCSNCAECESPDFCTCNSGWEGKDCCVDIDECTIDNGGCQQICHNVEGSRACDCEDGYTRDDNLITCTDIDECTLGTHECNHYCINRDGTYECSCETGYELGLDNHTCVDTGECGIQNGGCNQTCNNTIGSYHCLCDIGYNLAPDHHGCIDIDECVTDTDDCSHSCYNNIGSYTCDCPLGFMLAEDQTTCIDIDECSIDNGGCNQTCENTNGSYYCECLSGYSLDEDGHNCSDHNECLLNTHTCAQQCHNSHSSYYCTCELGYLLDEDGRTCNDINECENHLSGCNQHCNNTVGSYACDCYIGYELLDDPRECIDINECLFDNGGCGQNCTNLPGSYKCWCAIGYELNHDKHTCDDLDECALGTHECEHFCHNTNGSYFCTCEDGYYLEDNGFNCTDIDECATNNGGCAQFCVNEIASYHCECSNGYLLDEDHHDCYDINECDDSFNGGCDHNCTNSIGSYSCSCNYGYYLMEDQHSCYGQSCTEVLIAPQDGRITCTGEQVTDNWCSFSCDPGYQLRKSPKRRCKEDHSWTGTEPYCEPMNCRPPQRPNNAYIVTDPCPTELMSKCMVECVEGYHMMTEDESAATSYQQCMVNETTNRLYWTEPSRCIYKPPCSFNPCQHGGVCRNLNNYDYRCDCHPTTGYKGRNCETGIITVTQVPVILMNGDSPGSSTMTISCQPTDELKITMTTSDDSAVTTTPSTVTLSPTVTSSKVTVTSGITPGLYSIHFIISGTNSDTYETPNPMIVIVHDPNKPTNHTRYQYFDHVSQSIGILSPGCCEQSIQDYFAPNQQNIRFNSSCSWTGLDTTQSTSGITFASTPSLTAPLSITGSNLSVHEHGIPLHDLPSKSIECTFCNENDSLHCQYIVTVEDVLDFINCKALSKTFLHYSRDLLPEWLQISVATLDSTAGTVSWFDSYDIHAELLLGDQVIVTDGCESIQALSNSLYLVYRFNDSLGVAINSDISKVYTPRENGDPICFAVDVGKGNTSPFHISIPRSYHKEFMNIPPFDVYASRGWTVLVYEFTTSSNGGIDISREPHVTLPDNYFNGIDRLHTDSDLLTDFDVRIEMELLNNFTSTEDCRGEFTFYGDLYHSTNDQSKVQGALVGLINLKLNLTISGRNAIFLVEQNPGQPALFTLPEYSNSMTAIEGISFKTQYQPSSVANDQFFSKFFRSDLINCPADVFVRLTDDGNLNYSIIATSCPALKIGGLYIPTNSLDHSLYIPLIDLQNQPTRLQSTLLQDELMINEFLMIKQPDSGYAVDIEFRTNGGVIIGTINDCEFSMFDYVFTTQLLISDEVVSFTVPYVRVFSMLESSLHGVIKNGLEANDVKVLVTGKVLNDSQFFEELERYMSEVYIIDEITYLDKRLEMIQESKHKARDLFDHHYVLVDEKMKVLDEASDSYDSSRKHIESLTTIVDMYQSEVDALVNESLPLTSDILSLCSIVSCEDTCGVMDSCEVGVDRYNINEWGIESLIELDNLTQNIELDVDNYGWNIDYDCRIVTVIKSWGDAGFGQVCSYKTLYENNPKIKWVAEEKETNASHDRPMAIDSHELLLKTTQLTKDDCGMPIGNRECILSNAACRVAQRMSIESLSPTDAINHQAIIKLNEAMKNLSIAKSEASLAYYQMSVAQHNYRIHKRLLQELSDVLSYFNEYYNLLMKNNEILLALKPYVTNTTEDIFELDKVSFTTTVNDFSSSIIPVTVTYTVPLNNEELSTTITLDLHSPLNIILRDIAKAVTTDLGQLLSSSTNQTKEVRRSPVTNQQLFEQHCALVEDVRSYLMEINQTLVNAETSTSIAEDRISEITYEDISDYQVIDLNSKVNFQLMFEKFSISMSKESLLSEAKNEEDYKRRLQVITDSQGLEENVSSAIDDTEHLAWFIGINTIHNMSLLDSIGGEYCYGFIDCLSLANTLLRRINSDLPSYLPFVLDTTFTIAEDSLYSIALDSTTTPNGSLLDPMIDITYQIDSVGFWCMDQPVLIEQPVDVQYAEIGSRVDLACGPRDLYSFRWYKNGFDMAHTSPDYPILSMSTTDEGQYQCMAFNEAGRTYSSFFEVLITIEPEITTHPQNITTFEGSEDDALFICSATGWPVPAYSWYFSYDKETWYLMFNTSNEYIVYKPTRASEGWYRCSTTVLNTVLYSEPAYLTVIGASISHVSYAVSYEMLIDGNPTNNLSKLHDVVRETVQKGEDWEYGYMEGLTTELIERETLFVSFHITTSYQYSANKTLLEQAQEAGVYKNELDSIISRIRDRLNDGAMSFIYEGIDYVTLQSTFIITEEFFRCPPGLSLAYNGFICLNCSAGHHSAVVNNIPTCVPCERGTFTSEVGQGECTSCPLNMSTLETGLLTDETCTDQCEPGNYSETGLIGPDGSCTGCNKDEYQLEYGATSCEPCDNKNISSQCPPPTEGFERPPGFTIVTIAIAVSGSILILTILIIIIITTVVFARKKRDKTATGRSDPTRPLPGVLDGVILPEFNNLERIETRNPLYGECDEEDFSLDFFEYGNQSPDPLYASVQQNGANNPPYAEISDPVPGNTRRTNESAGATVAPTTATGDGDSDTDEDMKMDLGKMSDDDEDPILPPPSSFTTNNEPQQARYISVPPAQRYISAPSGRNPSVRQHTYESVAPARQLPSQHGYESVAPARQPQSQHGYENIPSQPTYASIPAASQDTTDQTNGGYETVQSPITTADHEGNTSTEDHPPRYSELLTADYGGAHDDHEALLEERKKNDDEWNALEEERKKNSHVSKMKNMFGGR